MTSNHRSIRALVRASALIAMSLAGFAGLTLTAQAQGNRWITDLPFIGTYLITCSWHRLCEDRYAPNNNMGGIDFALPESTMVYAAGNGTFNRVEYDPTPGYGHHTVIDHDAPDNTSLYAHLESTFMDKMAGDNMCRYVPIGYSGFSGMKKAREAHLHFESDSDNTPAHHFGPVYGLRSQGIQYESTEFTLWRNITKDCGPNGCDEDTGAYTVDDSQMRTTGEFSYAPRTTRYWRSEPGGFGYTNRARAVYWRTNYSNDPLRLATWRPLLTSVDPSWRIYVYIPKDPLPARQVEYRVITYDENGEENSVQIIIDQNASDNDWVALPGTFATHWSSTDPRASSFGNPITVQVTSRPVGDCVNVNACRSRNIVADAALFIPSSCP